jgi:spermidine/putrescine transport system permease protein
MSMQPSTVKMTASIAAEAAPRSRRHRSRGFDRPRFLPVVVGLGMSFFLVPTIVVLLFSFNRTRSLVTFSGFSTYWYRSALTSDVLRAATVASIEIALVSMSVATVCGTLLALGLHRADRRLTRVARTGVMGRLVTPETAIAAALFLFFTQAGMPLSHLTIMAGLVGVCLPFVTVTVTSRLTGLNPEVEAAAMDLGATRLGALRLVILPLILPTVGAAGMLAFILSFDNFVTALFTGGTDQPPLAIVIYGMLRYGVTPVINAVGVLMVTVSAVMATGALLLMRMSTRRTRR